MELNKLNQLYTLKNGYNVSPAYKPAKKSDPKRQWEKVKDAWDGDLAAWERYSGMSIDLIE